VIAWSDCAIASAFPVPANYYVNDLL
jgi:hypothetical protein